MVTEHGSQRWVSPVDEVAGIHRVSVDRLADLPATVAKNPKRFSRAVFDWEGKRVGYLAEDRVFDSLQGPQRIEHGVRLLQWFASRPRILHV